MNIQETKKETGTIVCKLTNEGRVFVNDKEVKLDLEDKWTARGLNVLEVLFFRKFLRIVDLIGTGTTVIYTIKDENSSESIN